MKDDRKGKAYDDLVRKVLSLDLAPGKSLDEGTLSETYKLSRTPLREVLQRLAGDGYVIIEANRGASVSSMDLAVMRNFFQIAPLVYAAISRLAAENATHGQLAELKSVQKHFRKAVDREDANQMVMLNHQFHESIGDMADSIYLRPSLRRLLIDHTRMSHRFYRPHNEQGRSRVLMASDQHDALIAALVAHDADAAAALTIEHWELSRGDIEKYVRPDPLPADNRDFSMEIV